jgi:hypothetical protein
VGAVVIARVPAVAALVLALGCGGKAEERATVEDTPAPAVVAEPSTTPAATQSAAAALLAWLDPDAIAVAWVNLSAPLDVDAFATVFAVPPKAAHLLSDVADIDTALDAVLPVGAPRPETWLGRESLAISTRFGVGTYVLRRLLVPKQVAIDTLTGARMRAQDVDGFTMLMPEGPLPFRVAFLTDDVVAFIPAREIGSGLGPLTAGRDLPPGGTERELTRVLEEEPGAPIELYAAGPLLHFDLGEDILQFALRARTWQDGLDVQVRLAPDGDIAAAAATLGKRDVSLETDAVRAMCGRVAFGPDGDFVEGRLQLTRDDLATLTVRP